MAQELKSQLEKAKDADSMSKESIYRDIALGNHPNDAESLKVKEEAIQSFIDSKVKEADAQGLRKFLTDLRHLFGKLPKAKTAKIVRNVIDAIAKVPNSTQLQVFSPVFILPAFLPQFHNASRLSAHPLDNLLKTFHWAVFVHLN